MLLEKLLNLFQDCEPDVRDVLADVLDKEWSRLSHERPRGIIEDIRQIIDAKARLSDNET